MIRERFGKAALPMALVKLIRPLADTRLVAGRMMDIPFHLLPGLPDNVLAVTMADLDRDTTVRLIPQRVHFRPWAVLPTA